MRTTQTKPVIQQTSYGGDAEKSDARSAEKSDASGAETRAATAPDPVPARRAAAIEITSPDRDKVVHVGEVEMEVSVNDEDVDNLMVAVYTPASEKPKSARTLELKRSDKGTKSFVVSLSKGDNRVEVSDLKRGEVKAERNITFQPADAPSIGGAAISSGGGAATRTDAAPSSAISEGALSSGLASCVGVLAGVWLLPITTPPAPTTAPLPQAPLPQPPLPQPPLPPQGNRLALRSFL